MTSHRHGRWAALAFCLFVPGLALAPAAGLAGPPARANAASVDPPNVVVIMTDDQRSDTLGTMPVVRRQIVARGKQFTGIIPTSTCCPSRVAFLTGTQAHTTGVYNNVGDHGGWKAFNSSGYEAKTLATALRTVGYRTALFGKYLNGWVTTPENYVPPGWDEFMAIRNGSSNPGLGAGAYYNYQLTGSEPTQSYADRAKDYSTDVITDLSVDFIRRNVDGQPLFLVMTPFAPHGPFTPAPRHVDTWSPATPYTNAAVNEKNMSDKPAFRQGRPAIARSYIKKAQTKTGQSLMAVDEGVRQVIRALGPEKENTLLVFMSDNGLMWGEHRLKNKYQPYRWSTEVPLALRWDGHIAAGSTGGLAANIDVTTTILDAAGATGALADQGRSLLTSGRKRIALEAVEASGHPAYCGIRNRNWLYVDYSGGEGVELYDYRSDPLELRNLAADESLRAKRAQLRASAERLCSPTPPGFTW